MDLFVHCYRSACHSSSAINFIYWHRWWSPGINSFSSFDLNDSWKNLWNSQTNERKMKYIYNFITKIINTFFHLFVCLFICVFTLYFFCVVRNAYLWLTVFAHQAYQMFSIIIIIINNSEKSQLKSSTYKYI